MSIHASVEDIEDMTYLIDHVFSYLGDISYKDNIYHWLSDEERQQIEDMRRLLADLRWR